MRSLEEFATEATAQKVHLRLDQDALSRVAGASIDGLFQAPILALTILVIARQKPRGLPIVDLATWTLGTLVRYFEGLRIARDRLQWSILLRRRCSDALVFLENVGLVAVRETPTRTVYISATGSEFLRTLAKRADEKGTLVRQVERAARAVDQSGLELL